MSTQDIMLPPNAACLIESLRDIGYSLESAIADVIDNSITAKAKNVSIFFDIENNNPIIAILDDGIGMSDDELLCAMKIGSKSPTEQRDKYDLGRFGLGLKTASFSQCRKLTVVSCRQNKKIAMCWDLDTIVKTNDWTLKILSHQEIEKLYKIDELEENGTLIIWENNDRIIDNTVSHKIDDEIYSKIKIVERHLELVFHRYLDGEFSKVCMQINGHRLKSFDPFNRANPATQKLPDDSISIGKQTIKIEPYILPHHSKTTVTEYESLGGDGGYVKNQGFYVYRNGRLLIHGTWFRILPQKELYKLARIQIDLPNALDDLWKIDVKKSHASPPVVIRDRLKKIVDGIVGKSTRVYVGRGSKEVNATNAFWEKLTARGEIRYAINNNHPFIGEFMDDLPEYKKSDFKKLLDYIGSFFPIELAVADYGQHPNEFKKSISSDDELEKIAIEKINSLKGKLDSCDFIDFFKNTEPTSRYTKDWKKFVEENV